VDEDAEPISYRGVAPGTPLRSSTGQEFGRLEQVLEIPAEDLFDGVIATTPEGRRFVDRDQIEAITTRYITCNLDDEAVKALPPPSNSPMYRAKPGPVTGLGGWLNRWLGRGKWEQDR
jgi:hypothetical protein